ncbi:hypothetical protein F443_19505, partial [Phytophthora nicotianae P1569]
QSRKSQGLRGWLAGRTLSFAICFVLTVPMCCRWHVSLHPKELPSVCDTNVRPIHRAVCACIFHVGTNKTETLYTK